MNVTGYCDPEVLLVTALKFFHCHLIERLGKHARMRWLDHTINVVSREQAQERRLEATSMAISEKKKGAFARRFDKFPFKNSSDVIQERLICLVPFGCGSYRSAFDHGPRCN